MASSMTVCVSKKTLLDKFRCYRHCGLWRTFSLILDSLNSLQSLHSSKPFTKLMFMLFTVHWYLNVWKSFTRFLFATLASLKIYIKLWWKILVIGSVFPPVMWNIWIIFQNVVSDICTRPKICVSQRLQNPLGFLTILVYPKVFKNINWNTDISVHRPSSSEVTGRTKTLVFLHLEISWHVYRHLFNHNFLVLYSCFQNPCLFLHDILFRLQSHIGSIWCFIIAGSTFLVLTSSFHRSLSISSLSKMKWMLSLVSPITCIIAHRLVIIFRSIYQKNFIWFQRWTWNQNFPNKEKHWNEWWQ